MFQRNLELGRMTATGRTDLPSAPIAELASSEELVVTAEAVLVDHAEFNETVRRLRELGAALHGSRAAPGPTAADLIEEFEPVLALHFAAEEAEEFFGSLVTDQPSLLRRVERLQADHVQMANDLDELLRFARSGPSGPELAAGLTGFLDQFEAHERTENALMQEFFLLDQGGGSE